MMFNFRHSSSASVFGVRVYGSHHDSLWHKLTIQPIYRAGARIRDGIWWIRYRVDRGHRYHMIDTRLPPRYYGIDTLMLHGMFSLLRRYVEEEHDGVDELERWGIELLSQIDQPEWSREADEIQGRLELEAVALYRWWMETLPAMKARDEELLELLYGGGDRISWTKDDDFAEYHRMTFRPDTAEEEALRREHDELTERINREETEMLCRLINIRGGLWT